MIADMKIMNCCASSSNWAAERKLTYNGSVPSENKFWNLMNSSSILTENNSFTEGTFLRTMNIYNFRLNSGMDILTKCLKKIVVVR